MRRDEVVDLLWRDVEESKARNAFRQALHRLRNAVGEGVLPQDRERLRLVRSDVLHIDIDRFTAAAATARFDDAVSVYEGDFLQDAVLGEPAFDLWVEQERVRLRSRFRDVLKRAISEASGTGDWHRAVSYARRLMQVAPFEPEAAQIAAATMVSAGQARDALDLLTRFVAKCESELGVSVPPEIRSLMSRLERSRDVGVHAEGRGLPQTLAFAGRESDLARLLTLWRTVEQDAGALALIEGEPGMGKSRLVHELLAHAKALRPGLVLMAHERVSPTPLGIFAEALRPLVRASGVAGASPHLLAEAARLFPELRDVMDLPAVADVEDEAARLRFFEGIAALVDAVSFERPVLIILEDLESIAPSSLDLLTYLASRLAGSPVMFVLTLRGEAPVAMRLRALSEASDVSRPAHGDRALRLVLPPLTLEASAEALRGMAAAAALDDAVVGRICRAAGGVPSALVDMLKRAGAGDEIGTPKAGGPEAVRGRIDRLASAQRRLLVVLALLRRPVDLQTLANAAHLSRSAARDAVMVLEAEGLAEIDDELLASVAPQVADVAADDAGSDARVFLSRWIAHALAGELAPSPSELARFHAAGGETAPAFDSYRRAAFDSLALGATVEAIAFLTFARSFATTPEQQAEVEGLLSGLGSGKTRLAPSHEGRPAPEERRPGVPEPARWERLFPHWRPLLGAAVATLLISTFVLWRTPAPVPTRSVPTDTLIVGEGDPVRALRRVTFDERTRAVMTPAEPLVRFGPRWLDSLPRAFTDAMPAPRGTHVALSRRSAVGRDLVVISADRNDTLTFTVGNPDAHPLDWSPDGRWVLAGIARRDSGAFDSDLIAFNVADRSQHVSIDPAAGRAIVEAKWSADGTHIAWVARVGDDRQLEVFVSAADGSARRNVSRDPADDYHIAWSGDGELLAYTSTRDGNAELYAYGVTDDRTWRLTRDPAQDDWAAYSPNGRWIAFESTRGGSAGIYVMPGLGGQPTRVASGASLSIREWHSGPSRYLEEMRVVSAAAVRPGDTARLRLIRRDQLGDSMPSRRARLRLVDSTGARLVVLGDSASGWSLLPARSGVVQVIASAGGWRVDTAAIRVGSTPVVLLQGAERGFESWLPLGDPLPTRAGSRTFVLESDREWESGILSREPAPLLPGLTFQTAMLLTGPALLPAGAVFGVALVAPEPLGSIDRSTPQFLKYASVSWNADARRLVFAVGREVFSEVVGAQMIGERRISMRIEEDSTVTFGVDGRRRWRSTLRMITDRAESRVQAWISARSTGRALLVREATIVLDSLHGPRAR